LRAAPCRASAAILLATLALSSEAAASSIVATLPEFDGSCAPAPCGAGIFDYTIPAGEIIVSARIAGTFGNSNASSSAPVDVMLDGLLVARCTESQPCFSADLPTPWLFDFAASQLPMLEDGSAALTALRSGGTTVRLGVTTLTIATVPEPSTALLLAAGLAALGIRRRGRRRR
jgi:hypothetical protein